ncbi:MAG: hypothetical protein M3081_03980 [Gemmatimonadota bacterium]|nr:hypothetical protein [Gemmatimonadota bacterium]
MSSLEKAKLMEIDENGVEGAEIPVQFNPQSLKLSLANKVQTQETLSQQVTQSIGMTSNTLSFELQFDTSDEGDTDAPVSVRTRTAAIERFVLPGPNGNKKQRPPKARFVWKDLRLDGIIEDLSIDFDLFAADGTPLRAKMSVTLKAQDQKYQRGLIGPGANTAGGARPPGASSAGPGSFGFNASAGVSASVGVGVSLGANVSVGASLTDSTRLALSGESAAEFTARVGLDPTAWRGVTSGLDSTLSLKGGAEVDFNASLSSGAGVGVTIGVEAGASASLEASFGLDARGAVPTPAGIALGGAGASAGFALASAGGVTAAMETVNILKAGNAAAATKDAFGATAGNSTAAAALGTVNGSATSGASTVGGQSPSATPAPPDQSRTPLALSGLPSATAQAAAAPAPAPPVADPRATSFGFGVPLRPRIGGAAEARRGTLSGQIPLRPNVRASDVLGPAIDPTAAPWTHLPVDASRDVADAAQRTRRPTRPCGCMGACSHGAPR